LGRILHIIRKLQRESDGKWAAKRHGPPLRSGREGFEDIFVSPVESVNHDWLQKED